MLDVRLGPVGVVRLHDVTLSPGSISLREGSLRHGLLIPRSCSRIAAGLCDSAHSSYCGSISVMYHCQRREACPTRNIRTAPRQVRRLASPVRLHLARRFAGNDAGGGDGVWFCSSTPSKFPGWVHTAGVIEILRGRPFLVLREVISMQPQKRSSNPRGLLLPPTIYDLCPLRHDDDVVRLGTLLALA